MGSIRILSASQVGTFSACSLKWAYRYVERAKPERRSAALVVGSSVDVAVKTAIHQVKSSEVPIEALDSERVFNDAWSGELASSSDVPIEWGKKGEAGQRETALAVTRAFLDAEDLPERIARIEQLDLRFELPLTDPLTGRQVPGVKVVGILDALERADGKLRPLDWKTAASRAGYSESELATHLQGSLYAWAVKEIYPDEAGNDVAFAVGLKLKKPEVLDRVVTITPAAIRRALLTVTAANHAMQRGPYFPAPSFWCGSCEYADRCRSWSGSSPSTPSTSMSPSDVFAEEVLAA